MEGIVKYSRANFLVPVPQVRSLEELNARLEQSCRDDLKRILRGEPREPEVFRLDGREHLKLVSVSCTDPGEYTALLGAASGKEKTR